jgi:peptide-methionine (S)-S-oxide reductase
MRFVIDMNLRTGKRLLAAAVAAALWLAAPPPTSARPLQTVVLAGGCFWGMQGVFERLRGVTTVVGYAGGSASTATYEQVSTSTTGHAESVKVTYDPATISFGQLLDVFFTVAHDPTELDRQGPDEGSQYRSVVFYTTPAQRAATLAEIAKLTKAHAFHDPIVTQVVPLRGFYPAEDYHQHYMDHHPTDPYIVFNDVPKVRALRDRFPGLLRR